MLVLNLPFKALMFLTLMRPSLVLFLVLWLKLVKDFLKVRCRLALLPFMIRCWIWLDLVEHWVRLDYRDVHGWLSVTRMWDTRVLEPSPERHVGLAGASEILHPLV